MALADITSSGILLPAQAKQFIKLLIKEAVVMKMATVVPMKSMKQQVDKIRFESRILRAGSEATALPAADHSKPTTSQVELDAKLFKAEVRLTDELLEDNIEQGALRNTILSMMGERLALDMDEVIIQGDTASADTFLAQFNGILKAATTNIVNAGTVNLNKNILRDMIKAMPSEFLRRKGDMRYLTSVDAEIDYRDSLSDRATALGDSNIMSQTSAMYSGIPMSAVPLFPENLGGGTNCTNVLLLDPKNINVGIWRNIRLETDKDISAGVVKVVATLRFDTKFAHEPAVVKATNVKVT
ncbi:MAG: phage major capsid protein [Pseudomonadota bacterium]|nr:phage major capsid protein [Pseudomonadota bacterium]